MSKSESNSSKKKSISTIVTIDLGEEILAKLEDTRTVYSMFKSNKELCFYLIDTGLNRMREHLNFSLAKAASVERKKELMNSTGGYR